MAIFTRLLLVASNLFPGDVDVNRAGEQRGRHCDAIHGRKKSDHATIYLDLLTSNKRRAPMISPIKDALSNSPPQVLLADKIDRVLKPVNSTGEVKSLARTG
jgi:hypothetical protein